MEFMRFDQGVVLRRELGPEAPNVVRLLIGTHHEKNGEACSRRRLLRAGHDPH